MRDPFVKFEEWEKTVPAYMKKDPLWDALYYRVALYLYDLVWDDCDLLQKDYRARHNIAQITHSSGSVSANMEEAYGRGVARQITFALSRSAWVKRAKHAAGIIVPAVHCQPICLNIVIRFAICSVANTRFVCGFPSPLPLSHRERGWG